MIVLLSLCAWVVVGVLGYLFLQIAPFALYDAAYPACEWFAGKCNPVAVFQGNVLLTLMFGFVALGIMLLIVLPTKQ